MKIYNTLTKKKEEFNQLEIKKSESIPADRRFIGLLTSET